MEGQLLPQKGVYTVPPIMEVDYLTGRLTTVENRALLANLLQHKLMLLIQTLQINQMADKIVSLATTNSTRTSPSYTKSMKGICFTRVSRPLPHMALDSGMKKRKLSSMLIKSSH